MDERIKQVVEAYQHYHSRSRPGKKEKDKIRERLNDGYTVQDLIDAIDGCHLSPFHCGQNDRNSKYQSLELIVRDSKHVQQFIELFEEAALKKKAEYDEWNRSRQETEHVKFMRSFQRQKRQQRSEADS